MKRLRTWIVALLVATGLPFIELFERRQVRSQDRPGHTLLTDDPNADGYRLLQKRQRQRQKAARLRQLQRKAFEGKAA